MTAEVNTTQAIKAAWDSRVDDYSAQLSDPNRRELAAEIELEGFQRALPAGRVLDILDAGCGVGFHGRRLLSKGHRIAFVDVSPQMLARARQETNREHDPSASFLECDIRNMLDIQSCSFDAIISGGTVISDCGNPTRAMAELVRVLRRDGVLGFSVRNLDGPQQKDSHEELIRAGGPGLDWWFLSLESVAKLCEQSGAVFRRAHPVFMEPPICGDIRGGVQRHLDAEATGEWRERAWELFVIAVKS